jgi:hypothetical protein
MLLSVIPWVLSGFLVYSCLSLAVSAWKREGRWSRRSGMSLLVGLLETAAVAGLFRLVVPWSPGTVALWVVAAVALAAAAAGVIIRWPELAARPRSAERLAADDAAAEHAAAGEEAPDRWSENAGTKTAKKPSTKPKKEPGKAAVAGHAGFLAAVVAFSFAIG